MKYTAMKLVSAIFVSAIVLSSVHAKETEEFTYGLKIDKLIIPTEENNQQSIHHFNIFSFYLAPTFFFPAFWQNHFSFGFRANMAQTPMAMMPPPFSNGMRFN